MRPNEPLAGESQCQAFRNEPRPKVPLTRFHSNTNELLDLALTSPVSLTKHGHLQWKAARAGYCDRMEQLAAGNV